MKKAFTLIELLAVIIILAILSLIATPTIINVINAAKDKSDLESVHGMVDSARLYYSESMMDENKKTNIENLNDIYNDVSLLNRPDNGKLYINEKGLIALSVVIRNKCYTKQFSGNIQISEDITNCTLGYVGIDDSAPTVSFSVLDGTFNSNGWAKNNFNVNITISDTLSGPSSYKYCIDTKDCEPIALVNNVTGFSEINTESETNKVCVIGIDNYGNESSIICSDNYKLDKTNPTIAVNNISINKNTTLDLNSDVITNDNLSGVDNYIYNPTSIDTSVAGDKTVTYTVTDRSGNSTSIDRTVTVITDKPSIAYSTLTSPNGNGWFNSNFYVKAIATSDSTSSINNILWCSSTSDCTPTSTLESDNVTAYITSNSATNKMCVQATDTTGNSSDIICSSNYKKDSVMPTLTAVSTAISIMQGTSYSTSSYFNAPTYGISGGILNCNPVNTSSLSVGSQTVSCTATSNSGLSTTANKIITVNKSDNYYFIAYANYHLNQYGVEDSSSYNIIKYTKINGSWTTETVGTITHNGFYKDRNSSDAAISITTVNENTIFIGYTNYHLNQYDVEDSSSYNIIKYTKINSSWTTETVGAITHNGFYGDYRSSDAVVSISTNNENMLFVGYTNYHLNNNGVEDSSSYNIIKYTKNNGIWTTETVGTITHNGFYRDYNSSDATLSISLISENILFVGYSNYHLNQYDVEDSSSYNIIKYTKNNGIWTTETVGAITHNGFYRDYNSSDAALSISTNDENMLFVGYTNYHLNEYGVEDSGSYNIIKYTKNNGSWITETVGIINYNGFYGNYYSSSAALSIAANSENILFVGYNNYHLNQYGVEDSSSYNIIKYTKNNGSWITEIPSTITHNGFYGSYNSSDAAISISN